MKSWKRWALFAAPTLLSGMLAFACDVDDEEAGFKPRPTGQDATTSSNDGATTPDGPTSVSGLCAKVGGPGTVTTISDAIYSNAKADCRIGAYFTRLQGQSETHTKECMRRFLQDVFDCPGVDYTGSKSSTGRECRDMQNAHDDLQGPEQKNGLNKADFQAYREVATAALKTANLSEEDLAKVGAVFLQYETQVAPRTTTEYNTNCTCPNGVGPTQKACIPDGGYLIPEVNVPDVKNDTGGNDADPDTGGNDAATD